METNRVIEIFELVKLHIRYTELKDLGGICGAIENLYEYDDLITEQEFIKIKQILYENKPDSNNEFAEFRNSRVWVGTTYWWYRMTYCEESRQIRIDFLNALIKKLTALEN